jgi:hypothetical protein
MSKRSWDGEKQSQPPVKRSPREPPTASSDDVGLVLSLFHRIQELMKIIDGSETDHQEYETMTLDEEEDPDELTPDEHDKLHWIMEWDTSHNLEWNWWYIRLYFQEHRRQLIDRFHATLNIRREKGTAAETTNTLNTTRTADDLFEEQNTPETVAEMQVYIATLEAVVGGYEKAAKLAADATTTKVFVLSSHFLDSFLVIKIPYFQFHRRTQMTPAPCQHSSA